MSGQSRSAAELLAERMATIQAIAAANTEQLRLNQAANGLMVLDMKDDRDDVTDAAHQAAQARTAAAQDNNMETINRLEQALATLDQELAAALRKDS
jgi:hypothetical protein